MEISKLDKEKFIDEFLDRLYMNGKKDDGLYILRLSEAENAAKELFDIIEKGGLIKSNSMSF